MQIEQAACLSHGRITGHRLNNAGGTFYDQTEPVHTGGHQKTDDDKSRAEQTWSRPAGQHPADIDDRNRFSLIVQPADETGKPAVRGTQRHVGDDPFNLLYGQSILRFTDKELQPLHCLIVTCPGFALFTTDP